MDISLIIPVRNEEQSLEILYEDIINFFSNLSYTYEIIFINDASTDDSGIILGRIQSSDKRVKVVSFKKQHGLAVALAEGFKTAQAKYILTMDGDLQYDIRDLDKIIGFLGEFDVVTGCRNNRLYSDGLVKFVSSRVANFVRNKVLREHFKDAGCQLRGYKSECVKQLSLCYGFEVFILSLLHLQGYRIKKVEVRAYKRKYGKTHFGISNRLPGSLKALFAVKRIKDRYLQNLCRQKLC